MKIQKNCYVNIEGLSQEEVYGLIDIAVSYGFRGAVRGSFSSSIASGERFLYIDRGGAIYTIKNYPLGIGALEISLNDWRGGSNLPKDKPILDDVFNNNWYENEELPPVGSKVIIKLTSMDVTQDTELMDGSEVVVVAHTGSMAVVQLVDSDLKYIYTCSLNKYQFVPAVSEVEKEQIDDLETLLKGVLKDVLDTEEAAKIIIRNGYRKS